jgi:F-type H+-transporting ATPase subunit gamma
MANAKEIRTKINSVKNTQKTTRAMEMVAASKMRRAQERSSATKPFAKKIMSVIHRIAKGQIEFNHPYMDQREVKRSAYIIVSTDRGLCGGLNINLFKRVVEQIQQDVEAGIEVDLCLIGKKAQAFFKRFKVNIVAATSHLGDAPKMASMLGIVKTVLESFEDKNVDRVYLCHNEFINTMKQEPEIEQLLPLKPTNDDSYDHYWDYIYEPDERELLDKLLQRYVESQVYQGVIENLACQQAATMVAMKSASDNAGELIKEFQLAYNKARQAAITQEIAEIVGGSEAV